MDIIPRLHNHSAQDSRYGCTFQAAKVKPNPVHTNTDDFVADIPQFSVKSSRLADTAPSDLLMHFLGIHSCYYHWLTGFKHQARAKTSQTGLDTDIGRITLLGLAFRNKI
jgi:hypothetical protein